jgi:uncharacterized protein YaiI (UPF0178 family)
MPDIYVDADACPVKRETCKVALRHGLGVTFVSNAPMRMKGMEAAKAVVVGGGFDEADDYIAGHVSKNDIVVTADIPLASRCVKNGAGVLAPDGRVFSDDNIGEILASRNLMSELRQTGAVSGGPPPFQKKDRSRFLQNLERMILEIRRGAAHENPSPGGTH